jgi:hypothetical protein
MGSAGGFWALTQSKLNGQGVAEKPGGAFSNSTVSEPLPIHHRKISKISPYSIYPANSESKFGDLWGNLGKGLRFARVKINVRIWVRNLPTNDNSLSHQTSKERPGLF